MNDTVIGVVVGALSTTLTGVLGSEYASWRERSKERKALKSAIQDELSEQANIISNMEEVWEKTKTLVPSYIFDLKSCTGTYENLRQRLFLIKEKETRNKIISYYKDLRSSIAVEGKRAGTLSKSAESQNEQGEIANKFSKLRERAEEIMSILN